MTPIFADTSYFLAILSPRDQYHERAVAWSRTLRVPVVTTEYVLVEVGNSLTKGEDRELFVEFHAAMSADDAMELVPATTEWLDHGIKLFSERSDKEWSLTDCISFVVMTDRAMTDALTADRDFEQAGFRALLRHDPNSTGLDSD